MTIGPLDDWPPLDDLPPGFEERAREIGGRDRVADADPQPSGRIRATPFVWRDPASIPPREWLYGRHMIRRFLSATMAPGAAGKSSLAIVEALAMVTGRALLGVSVPQPLRVWYVNLEDPLEETERRVIAACIHYGIDPSELDGRLFLDSGRTTAIVIATENREGVRIAEPVVADLIETIRANQIDLVTIDPFVSSHSVSENSNSAIDAVAKAWNRIAEEASAAVELVHHVRKGQAGQGEYTVEDGRGAGALLAAARSARVLNVMSREQAERAGLASHRGYFRADNGKANLAPPPDQSNWYRLVPVSLGNGPMGLVDASDHVAVVTPWQWPDPMAEVTVADLRAAQTAVRAGGPWRENVQARDWVGRPIALALRLDPDGKRDREKVKRLLKTWIGTGMFVVVMGKNDKGRDTPIVEVGEAAAD